MYLNSQDSKHIYPDNNGTTFTVRLPERMKLERGKWQCGLIECCLRYINMTPITYYIGTDITTPQNVNGVAVQTLRMITTEEEYPIPNLPQNVPQHVQTRTYEFGHIMYHPVRLSEFETVTMFLKQRDLNVLVSTAQIVTCILHFIPEQ